MIFTIEDVKNIKIELDEMRQQLNDPKIRELVLSGPFKVYVSNGNSYKELPDSPLPYMHKGHVEKFIGGAK